MMQTQTITSLHGKTCAATTAKACRECAPSTTTTIFEAMPGIVLDRAATEHADRVRVKLCRHLQSCRECAGSGLYMAIDAHGYEVSRPCPLRRLRHIARQINAADVPAQYADARQSFYTDPAQAERMQRLQRWASGAMRRSVWIAGHPGRGKSCMATIALAKYLLAARQRHDKRVPPAIWADTPTLLRQSRAAERSREHSPARDAMACGLLVLDDIDKVMIADRDSGLMHAADDELLWRLLKQRAELGRPTLITSNILHTDWLRRSRNARALASRINGHYELMGLPGPDHRQTEPAQ